MTDKLDRLLAQLITAVELYPRDSVDCIVNAIRGHVAGLEAEADAVISDLLDQLTRVRMGLRFLKESGEETARQRDRARDDAAVWKARAEKAEKERDSEIDARARSECELADVVVRLASAERERDELKRANEYLQSSLRDWQSSEIGKAQEQIGGLVFELDVAASRVEKAERERDRYRSGVIDAMAAWRHAAAERDAALAKLARWEKTPRRRVTQDYGINEIGTWARVPSEGDE